MPRGTPTLPLPVRRALRGIGSGVRDARRRRRLPTAVLANRAGITLPTLRRVERGDPAVSFGIYASVLYALGLLDKLIPVASAQSDSVGLALEEERLPQRVRRRRSEGGASSSSSAPKRPRDETP